METPPLSQQQPGHIQQSMDRHRKNYQKYLNNIYQTIRQKEFYIHRAQTPTVQMLNKKQHDISKLSNRSEKTSNTRGDGLKSLPKLSAKQTLGHQVMEVVLGECVNQNISKSRANSPSKKIYNASSSGKDKRSTSQQQKNSQKNNYQFGNFPESRPSPLYMGQTLRESKQLSKNSTIAKQKMLQQKKPETIKQKPTIAKPAFRQNQNEKLSLYKKISKDNMNLLGLNVEKMNYSEKRDTVNSNRRFMFVRITKAQQANEDQDQNEETVQNNCEQVYLEGNITQNYAKDSDLYRTSSPTPEIDLALCQQLISQKMQFSKRSQMSSNRNTNALSPTRQRRRISAQQKKVLPQQTQQLNPIYENRYRKYLQLILRLTISYKKYGQLDTQINPSMHTQLRNDKKYKAWVGNGNNGNLLKALIKRRYWWQIVDEKSWGVNFLWTQLKNNEYFKVQGQKLKANKLRSSDRQQKQSQTKSTNLDESTCLSLQNQKSSDTSHILSLAKKTRAQSSLPGSISNKKKQLSSPIKKARKSQQNNQPQSTALNKLFTQDQIKEYKQMASKLQNRTFSQKLDCLKIQRFSPFECRMHNHLINNFYLGNKKALFHNLKEYYSLTGGDLFKTVPLTFHIKKGIKDPQYKRFLAYYKKRQTYIKKQEKEMQLGMQQKRKMRNIWIVKPGQNTNRGNGITVIDQVYELNSIFKSQGTHSDGSQKTFIVQLYIDRPLLYKKRKFDIRHYMLITHVHGVMKGYWFEQGYIRTSGYEFDVENFEREIHLTNDAVQKYTPNYGRFQPANKISYAQFQKYLDQTYPKKGYDFYGKILPRMKEVCLDAIKSACLKISPEKLEHNFELFGMDFMIDSDFVPWLIEINTNPCLELTNALQTRIIPQVVDEALRLTLDVIYPPPCHYPNTCRHLVPDSSNMKAELVFDENIDGEEIRKLYQKRKTNQKALLQEIGQLQDDEVYEDEGQQDLKLQQLLQ